MTKEPDLVTEYFHNKKRGILKFRSVLDKKGNGCEEHYYKNGKIERRHILKGNKEEGVREWFYHNGNQMSRLTYKNGRISGCCEWFYRNGNIKAKGVMRTTRKKTFVFGDTWETGTWEKFHENGKLMSKENFKRGLRQGLCEYFYSNGNRHLIDNYKAGKRHGISITYHKNARPGVISNYKNGKLDGRQIFLDNRGGLTEAEELSFEGITFSSYSGKAGYFNP